MENWKRVLLAGAAGLSTVCLIKGSRTGALVFGGVALATLASEYPEEFARFRRRLPDYIDRGSELVDTALRLGERMAALAETRGTAWYEALMRA
jgi:hypothetical protein